MLCARRPVSLLSVFGGTTFSFDPFQLQAAQIIASDYTLDEAVDKDVAKLWWVRGWCCGRRIRHTAQQ